MSTAAIYVRVSTEDQVLHGVSLETQQIACYEKAVATGAKQIIDYRDEGLSGMMWDRPGLQSLLANLANIDTVIVWTKDRLARNLQHLLQIITSFTEHGVRLIALYEHVATDTADGMFALQVSGAAGEYHARRTAENVKAAGVRIARSGKKPSGHNYGYQWINKEFVIHPAEAKIVQEIFNLREAGLPPRKIAFNLMSRGIASQKNGVWCDGFIAKILSNPTYIGKFTHGGQVYQGSHEPIITQAQFDRVQLLAATQAGRTGPQMQTAMPIFKCGYCGSAMGRASIKRAGGYVASMFCNRMYQIPHELRHETCTVLTDKAFAMVWRHTELLITEGVLADAIDEQRKRIKALRPEAKGIEKQLVNVALERSRLQQMVVKGMMRVDEAELPLLELEAQRVKLERHLNSITLPEDIDMIRRLAKQGRKIIEQMMTEPGILQLQFLRMIYDRIELTKGQLTFISRDNLIPPVIRAIPTVTMYCPLRGKFDIGF